MNAVVWVILAAILGVAEIFTLTAALGLLAVAALAGRPQQLGPEVGDAGEHLGPVPAHLLAAHERPVGMQGLLAAVPRVEAGDEAVEVVGVLGVAEPLDHVSSQRSRLLWGRPAAGSGAAELDMGLSPT